MLNWACTPFVATVGHPLQRSESSLVELLSEIILLAELSENVRRRDVLTTVATRLKLGIGR